MIDVAKTLLKELEQGRSAVLVTVIAESGSAPRGPGAQMLVGERGRIAGTVGGGSLEFNGERLALELLGEKKTLQHEFLLYVNDGEDIGMVCGGNVTLDLRFADASDPAWPAFAHRWVSLLEANGVGSLLLPLPEGLPLLADEAAAPVGCVSIPLAAADRVLLFGAGHVSAALAPLLAYVGFRLTVIDSRPELLTKERFPMAEALIEADFTDLSGAVEITPRDYVVVMTSGHSHDYDVERQALRAGPAYLGVIGSRRKIAAVNTRLEAEGFARSELATVHTPIGLPIGAVTPNEIAVSVAAEMIQVRAERRAAVGIAEKTACPMHE